MLVVFRESGKNPTMSHQHALKLGNFNQITNTMDYRWSLHMQWFFAAGPELMLLLQGTRSNSKCILSIYVY